MADTTPMSNHEVPTAPRHRRVRPGMVKTTDPQGRVWTVEERPDTFGGGSGWAWFASSDDFHHDMLDPTPTMRESLQAVARMSGD